LVGDLLTGHGHRFVARRRPIPKERIAPAPAATKALFEFYSVSG
jgi:hypothetical protein